MTAKELADIFEVSERIIYRDTDKLTIAGSPIYTNQGNHKIDGYFSYAVPPLEGLWWQKRVDTIDYSYKKNFQWIGPMSWLFSTCRE